jgi:predicted HNH restriction endonuclease
MFATFRNSSRKSGNKNKSILKTYIDFYIGKSNVSHIENKAKYIDVKDFVHREVMLNKHPSKEALKNYTDKLYNEQDQLLLWLPFIGVRGRTVDEGAFEEIINLTIDDVFPNEHRLILRQNDGKNRELNDVEDFIFDLIKETFAQQHYVENNGEITNNPRIPDPRRTKINNDGEFSRYVFRIPGKNKYAKFNTTLLNARQNMIQKMIDNPYITYTSVFEAGMIQLAMKIYEEKGQPKKQDFIDICDRFNYGEDGQYWFNINTLFKDYKELVSEDLILTDEERYLLTQLTSQIPESNIENTETEEELLALINSAVGNASIEIRQALVKIRRANRKTIDGLKSIYNNSCQICETYFSQTHGVEVVEAHHIEYFSQSLNHHPTNIVIVCPNHHRLLHKGNATFDRKLKEFIYDNGYKERLKLNRHL